MQLNKLPMFDLIQQRLGWLNQRHQVLSQNIANADTPKYRAQDLKLFDFKSVLQKSGSPRMRIAVTNSMHMTGLGGQGNSAFKQITDRKPYETAPDGNSVVLEEQMVKMNENTINHSTMTRLYQKHMQMFRSVLRAGGR